jgi:mRNA-degrading endonuclease RelE of RelBE toxin-antitoxin system
MPKNFSVSYNIVLTKEFDKEIKRLSKKHPSLRKDFASLLSSLENDPIQGVPLGNECFKIRLSIKSKSSGKSGGARVITCVKIVMNTVILLSIYDKSEKANIPDKEIKERLKKYLG